MKNFEKVGKQSTIRILAILWYSGMQPNGRLSNAGSLSQVFLEFDSMAKTLYQKMYTFVVPSKRKLKTKRAIGDDGASGFMVRGEGGVKKTKE